MAYSGLLSAWLAQIKTMTGATSNAAGASGFVPAPAAGDDTKFLRGDGSWIDITSLYDNANNISY